MKPTVYKVAFVYSKYLSIPSEVRRIKLVLCCFLCLSILPTGNLALPIISNPLRGWFPLENVVQHVRNNLFDFPR